MPKATPSIRWSTEPEEHDYPAALSYLSLIYADTAARAFVDKLRHAAVVSFKAKDVFRASRLPLLDISNSHVAKDQQKVESAQALSPLLLVRDSARGHVIIADGYHRLCAVYAHDEDAVIPCKIA